MASALGLWLSVTRVESPGESAPPVLATALSSVIDNCDRGTLGTVFKTLLGRHPELHREAETLFAGDSAAAAAAAADRELAEIYEKVTEDRKATWDHFVRETESIRQRAAAYQSAGLTPEAAHVYVSLISSAAGWLPGMKVYDYEDTLKAWDDALFSAILDLGADGTRARLEAWKKELEEFHAACEPYGVNLDSLDSLKGIKRFLMYMI